MTEQYIISDSITVPKHIILIQAQPLLTNIQVKNFHCNKPLRYYTVIFIRNYYLTFFTYLVSSSNVNCSE